MFIFSFVIFYETVELAAKFFGPHGKTGKIPYPGDRKKYYLSSYRGDVVSRRFTVIQTIINIKTEFLNHVHTINKL